MAWNPGYVSYGGYFSSIVPICHAPLFRYFFGSRDLDYGNYMQAYWEADSSRCHADFDTYQGIAGIGGAWIISQTGEPDFGYADLCKFPLTDGIHEPTKLVCLQLCAQSYDLETGIIQLGLRYVRKDLATNTIEYAQPMLGNQQLDIGNNVLILNSIHLCLQVCADDQSHRYLNAALVLKKTDGGDYWTVGSRALPLDIVGGVIPDGTNIDLTERDDPNEDDDTPSTEGGGGGSHDPSSDIVREGDIDDLITVTGGGCGFITYYKITQAQLNALAAEMFNMTFRDAVHNFFEKPIEIVSGVLLLPITPASGASYHPKYGVFHMDLALPIVANQFKDVDCGSVYVDEYYSSAFDYSPFSKCSIFLPFIGVREIDVDEVMGKWLHVKYRIDCYTGNCLAILLVGTGTAGSETVRYQFAGNCGQQIPIGGEDFSNVINGALTVATVAAASIVTAGAAGAAAGTAAANAGASIAETELVAQSAQAAANTKAAMDIGAAAVNQVMNAKPIVTRSGSMGCSMGMMGVLKPYILKEVPRQSLPNGYKSFYGYPANISGYLSEFSGYTVVDSVKLKGIPATDSEIAEIERALKGGVFL